MSMDFSFASLFGGLIWGAMGVYFIKRAKKDAHIPYAFVGLALFGFPFFVENIYLTWAIGIGLVILGFRL